MNIRAKLGSARERGETILELLVYFALFMVVVGSATVTFYECWGNSKALRRNADDIVRVLSVGDRWRADVRAAQGPIELTAAVGTEQCRIPGLSGEIVYTFSDGEIRRQAGSSAPNTRWLANVKSSQMQRELRGGVTAWRWELELKSVKREARLRPLFTFESAAGKGGSQ